MGASTEEIQYSIDRDPVQDKYSYEYKIPCPTVIGLMPLIEVFFIETSAHSFWIVVNA